MLCHSGISGFAVVLVYFSYGVCVIYQVWNHTVSHRALFIFSACCACYCLFMLKTKCFLVFVFFEMSFSYCFHRHPQFFIQCYMHVNPLQVSASSRHTFSRCPYFGFLPLLMSARRVATPQRSRSRSRAPGRLIPLGAARINVWLLVLELLSSGFCPCL